MKIPTLAGFNFLTPTIQNKKQETNNNYTKYNITMPKALSHDTVSFGATEKMLKSRTYGISLKVAKSINEQVEPMQKDIKRFMNKTFGDLLVTDLNPMNDILFLKDRAKKPVSIAEKSATRQWNCKAEVLNFMTDLNGGKIVMRDGNVQKVEKVLERLIPLIKKGKIELLEIENKRPIVVKGVKGPDKTKYDYATEDFLENLRRTQEQKWKSINPKDNRTVRFDMNDYTKANYMAIHMLLKLPHYDRPFELMIMGKDINALKDLDDLLFKILNKKNVDKKYKPIVDIVSKLNEQGNANLLEEFNKYRGEAFIFQRIRQPKAYSKNEKTNYFLPLTSDLPPEYDLNNLSRIIQECNEKAVAKLAKQKK